MATVINDPSQSWLYRIGQNFRNYAPAAATTFTPFNPLGAARNIWTSVRGVASGAANAESNFRASLGASGTNFLNTTLLPGIASLKAGVTGEPLPDWANPPTVTPPSKPNKFAPSTTGTPAAVRVAAIGDASRNRATGVLPSGNLNITTKFGDYKNVSPEFARTAGAITPEQESVLQNTLTPDRTAAARTSAQKAQEQINRDTAAANEQENARIRAQRALPYAGPNTVSGLTDSEKMARFGTRFPEELPMNPTNRDVTNLMANSILRRLPRTATPGVSNSAVAGAAEPQ